MAHNVEIEVFPIAKTHVDREQVQRWVECLGIENYELPENISDPSLLVALAAKRCYKSFDVSLNKNLTKVRKDWTEYLDNVLKSGHGSTVEHSVYTFAIENVSRVFTGEMNRHRAGVGISEGSMRFIRYDDIAWWMPLSLRADEKIKQTLQKYFQTESLTPVHYCPEILDKDKFDYSVVSKDAMELEFKKAQSRAIFTEAFEKMQENYVRLTKLWNIDDPNNTFHNKKELTSCFRRIVGMGVATGGVWTMNLRAVRHIIGMRSAEGAEEEIAYVFSKIAKIMIEDEPMLFADFTQDENGFYRPKYWKV